MYIVNIWPLLLASLVYGSKVLRDKQTHDCHIVHGALEIKDPEDVITHLKDCWTIYGDISIADDFAGPLRLPSVVTIEGSILAGEIDSINNNAKVTAIDAPDLQRLQGLRIMYIMTMTQVSMPKLTSATWLRWSAYGNTTISIDLRSLLAVEYLFVDGEFSRINLDSLQTADKLAIYGPGRYGEDSGISFDALLPELKFASTATILGRFSSVSIPKLNEIGQKMTIGCALGNRECPVSPGYTLELSQLSQVTGEISVYGPITNLSIPSLQKTKARVKIGSSAGLNLSLPLVEATHIELDGRLESIHFPNLVDLKSISMRASSGFDFDCKAFCKEWEMFTGKYPRHLYVSCRGGLSESEPSGGYSILYAFLIALLIGVAVLLLAAIPSIINCAKGRPQYNLLESEVKEEDFGDDEDIK